MEASIVESQRDDAGAVRAAVGGAEVELDRTVVSNALVVVVVANDVEADGRQGSQSWDFGSPTNEVLDPTRSFVN